MFIVTVYDIFLFLHPNRLEAEYFGNICYPNIYLRTIHSQINL